MCSNEIKIIFIDKKGNKKIKKMEELNKAYRDSIYDTIKSCLKDNPKTEIRYPIQVDCINCVECYYCKDC